jgi:hypothetical protein
LAQGGAVGFDSEFLDGVKPPTKFFDASTLSILKVIPQKNVMMNEWVSFFRSTIFDSKPSLS